MRDRQTKPWNFDDNLGLSVQGSVETPVSMVEFLYYFSPGQSGPDRATTSSTVIV